MCWVLPFLAVQIVEPFRVCPGSCPKWLPWGELALIRNRRLIFVDPEGGRTRTPKGKWNRALLHMWAPKGGGGLLVLRRGEWGWFDLRKGKWTRLAEFCQDAHPLFKFYLPSPGWMERIRQISLARLSLLADISLDGRRAVFFISQDEGTVGVADLPEGRVKRVKVEGEAISISPDGSTVAVSEGLTFCLSDDDEGLLKLVDLRSGEVESLKIPPPGWSAQLSIRSARWSPKGDRLALIEANLVTVKAERCFFLIPVVRPAVVSREGEVLARLGLPPNTIGRLQKAFKGLERLKTRVSRRFETLGEHLMGRRPKRFLRGSLVIGFTAKLFETWAEAFKGTGTGAFDLRWSPDGEMLAAVCDNSLGNGLWGLLGREESTFISILDGRLREVYRVRPQPGCADLLPSWSHKGDMLAFERVLPSGRTEVWVARLPR